MNLPPTRSVVDEGGPYLARHRQLAGMAGGHIAQGAVVRISCGTKYASAHPALLWLVTPEVVQGTTPFSIFLSSTEQPQIASIVGPARRAVA